ncbi:MAG: hypothetical protein ACREQT_12710 [Candidatus Binataceae bacterium]
MNPPRHPNAISSYSDWLVRNTIREPSVQIALGAWIIANVLVWILARGVLPFDRPALLHKSFALQMALPSLGMIEIFMLMGVIYFLTRRRLSPDLAARAPEPRIAARETARLLIYAALGEAGGWMLGPALGYRPFSFHIAGTLYGSSAPPSPGEIGTWATYNFLVFAVAPFLWFGRRYSAEQLNLRSSDRRNDLTVIIVVAAIESLVELGAFPGFLRLSGRQMLIGAPTAFLAFFVGTVMPTMVLIYAILIPRYLRLNGSRVTTILFGGLTYAAMHIVEGWSLFATPRETVLSLIFVLLTYFGPGMIKTFITLRTGNAWVHALGYHAIAPHVVVDTPLIVKAFAIR